jgi:thioredoxin reductase
LDPLLVLEREIDNILRLGVELQTNTALGRDFTLAGLFAQGYQAVFLGIGCQVGKPLSIPGEDADGVIQGVEFLRRQNLEEPLAVGNRLAVIGGGNVAIDVACTARRLGSKATIIYRRSRDEMPAFAHEIEQALCEGVEIVYLAAPLNVVKGNDGQVSGLVCQKMELGEPDASGRRQPAPIPGATFGLPVDMIAPAIGQEAAPEPLQASGVKLSRWGTIEVNAVTYETSRPRIFAAGDVHTGPWIAIEAVAGGSEAVELLRSLPRHLTSDYVFFKENGEPYKYIYAGFREAIKRAGIEDCTPHILRHTVGSRLVMAGVDLTTVKELLGHQDIQTTMRYAHLAQDHKRAAIGKIGKLVTMDTNMDTKDQAKEKGLRPKSATP